jgi:Zn-dependent protease
VIGADHSSMSPEIGPERGSGVGNDDDIDGVVFDDEFVRGGKYEPPARTRAAIARYGDAATSWRQAAPLRTQPTRRTRSSRSRPVRQSRGARREPVVRRGRAARRAVVERRISPIFVGLVGATAAFGYALWVGALGRFGVFCFVLAGWLVSLCLHEFGHALVGFHGGDRSIAARGYLRLDPRRYIHPVLSLVLPIVLVVAGGIGLPGGAVWIDKGAIRSRWSQALTSLAGPAVNALCALACLAPFMFPLVSNARLGAHSAFFAALTYLGVLQICAVVINLLPIPGLDGWGALEGYLPRAQAEFGRRVAPVALPALFFLMLAIPALRGDLGYLTYHLSHAMGAPRGLPELGQYLMRFWDSAA